MCGIAGISFSPLLSIDPNCLNDGVLALSHRGPDDSGVFADLACGVGLVHTRLSIIDPSPLGHQPMMSDDGNVVLVFNGEIYNFLDLRAELEVAGHVFRGHSDTEVLLHFYLEHRSSGRDFISQLRKINGIFAFAIWDKQANALLVARDALGVKPLYYSEAGGIFSFASEIKALQGLVGPIEGLDYPSLDRYMSFLWCPGEGTPALGVKKLGPGEAVIVKRGVIEERHIWYRLPVFRSLPSGMGLADAVNGTAQHLRRAVHRQMVSDVPLGAFLSGGLDSSSIVALARERNPDIRCFTIESLGRDEQGRVDDLPYARRVAEHLGVKLEVVQIDALRMAQDLAQMVEQLDEPLADPAPLNVLYISRLAREHGIKVLLSGAGGDDLFTGYRRHQALQAERYWRWLPPSAQLALKSFSGSLDQRLTVGRRLGKLFSGADLDGDARLVHYFLWSSREDLMALYSPGFRAALGDASAEDPMLSFLAELPAETSPLMRMLALEQRFFLTDHNLTYTDKMSMAAGVEVRVPFLDLDLVEFAQQIPEGFKQRGSEGKWVLKKAMEPYLPHDVIYRPKTGFGAPLRHWMRYELRELLCDLLSPESLRRRGLFDPVAVDRLIAANDAGRVDASYTLLSLLCIELWCRRFMDGSISNSHYGDGT